MKLLPVLAAMLILLPVSAEAVDFEEYSVGVNLDGRTSETISAVFSGADREIGIEIGNLPENIRAELDNAPIDVTVSKSNNAYKISFIPPDLGAHKIVLNFMMKTVLDKTSRGTMYTNAFTADADIESYSLTVSLPPGATISFEDNAPLISPNADIRTDGRVITLGWKDSLERGESFTAVVVYQNPASFPSLGVLLAAALIPLAYAAYKIYSKHRPAKIESKRTEIRSQGRMKVPLKSVRDMLTEDENRILDIVMKADGKTMQNALLAETNFSKSKVSKVLRGLEMKGVIVKKPYGRNNIIRIADKYAA